MKCRVSCDTSYIDFQELIVYAIAVQGKSGLKYPTFTQAREQHNYRTMALDVQHWLSPQWCHVDNKRFEIIETT